MHTFYCCRVSISVMRSEPSDKAEISSQLLFGDRVELIEKNEKWCRVKSKHDNYEGWVDEKQIIPITIAEFYDDEAYSYLTPLHVLNKLEDQQGDFYYLTAGTTLPYYNNGECYVGGKTYKVHFQPVRPSSTSFYQQIASTANFFTNAPYLWGGRSLFGIDCSGFSQIVYKLCGLQIARDAYQQAEQGEVVDFLAGAIPGDLAFFDNEEGKISHVGIMLNNAEIIHAAGRVHVDPIDNQGIFSRELGRYTHKLRIIKRLMV
ncbi:MAG: hydrolase [Pedobacter sp.]|nr:MAG: hydrolase [Pedobacter sp.]